MLAKLWKKVLLAICIIACIFNIMSKLVNRHSLRENLESVNDGITVFSIFQKDEVIETESEPIIDGVMNPQPEQEATNEEDTTVVLEENNSSEVTNAETEEQANEAVTQETDIVEETTEQPENNRTFKFSDFTILF